MFSIALIGILAFVGLVYLWLLYFLLSSILRSDSRWGLFQTIGLIVLVILIAAPVSFILLARHTPPARAIDETVDITSESGDIHISAIRMAAPDYGPDNERSQGGGYESVVVVTMENRSDEPIEIDFLYATSGGMVGAYSPGSTTSELTRTAPANWSGELEFPFIHTRFVSGGYVGFSISSPSGTLLQKEYDMVVEE